MAIIKQTITTALLVAASHAIGNRSIGLAVSAQSNARPVPNAGIDPNVVDRESYHTHTVCPKVPSLHCKNGSTCEPGIAAFGRQHDHLGLQTHESGYYCKCLPGFIGHECTIQVDDCDGSSGYNPSDPTGVLSSCYHGASCKSNDGDESFYCDCEELNYHTGSTATKFAGLMCQHESTGLCASSLAGEVSPNHQFCTNHGKCVKLVTGGEPHPGCVCRDGYAGDHCELRVDPLVASVQQQQQQQQRGSGNKVAGKILFSLMMIAMGSVSIAIIVIFVQARKKQRLALEIGAGGENNTKMPDIPPATGKIVLGAGDLDPDGSGTLGKPSVDSSNNEEFVIGDGHDEEDAGGDLELTVNDDEGEEHVESEKPEIV